jgi:ABC-type transporter Mla subunit MlaD
MSDRGAGMPEAVVQFAPKPNAKPGAGDPLDQAAQAILGSLHRAAAAAEANHREAVEMTRQLTAQLRGAEDRIRELEAHARHQQDRAERAERWLHQVSVEIEQRFFGRTEERLSQPPPPAAFIRNQRR